MTISSRGVRSKNATIRPSSKLNELDFFLKSSQKGRGKKSTVRNNNKKANGWGRKEWGEIKPAPKGVGLPLF